MSLSRKEQEEVRPVIDRTVQKFLGFSEPTLVTAACNCLGMGYNKNQTKEQLAGILDEGQAGKFTDRLFTALEDYKLLSQLQKNRRKRERVVEEDVAPTFTAPPVTNKKKKRFEEAEEEFEPAAAPSPGQLTSDKIKEMMANAQKMIEERKNQLKLTMPAKPAPPPEPEGPLSEQQMYDDTMDKARKAAVLQAGIQQRLASMGLPATPMPAIATLSQLHLAPPQTQQPKAPQTQPTPLILDEQGRTIDAQTGETIQLTHHMPTLKANIRAKKREQFKTMHDKPPEEISETKFFDPRVSVKGAQRSKRQFKFHDIGKFETMAQRLRTKAQLEKLQGDIAQAARKTGIASATKLAAIAPKKELALGEIPEVEWWDEVLTQQKRYEDVTPEILERLQGITHLVEHPMQMKPPADPEKDVQQAVMLTKRERKKLRRQNRLEMQKEATEKVRLGLVPPPEPKVRMANLMRVLGTEAVQDPTKVEAHVRAQMAKRQKAHEESNATRKLTKEQRREKKARKLKEDTSLGVHVSVYRVGDLSNPSKKFKVETNANQLFMTGLVVLHKDCNVVVVEGGPKQQKKYRRLMVHRIKWVDDKPKGGKNKEPEDGEPFVNSCKLVWEGMVQSRAFGEMKFKMCPTESLAREQFRKSDVEHYWDLAYSGSILEATSEDV